MSQKFQQELENLKTGRERYDYLKKHKLWCFNIIFTFDNEPQQIFDALIGRCTRDDELLVHLFQLTEIDKLPHLIKISTSMQFMPLSEYPEFLMKRNGKYYFNTDINSDEDTKLCNQIKQIYIEEVKN